VCTHTHTHIHTYIPTEAYADYEDLMVFYTHTYTHTYTHIHTYMHTEAYADYEDLMAFREYMHTYTHTYMRTEAYADYEDLMVFAEKMLRPICLEVNLKHTYMYTCMCIHVCVRIYEHLMVFAEKDAAVYLSRGELTTYINTYVYTSLPACMYTQIYVLTYQDDFAVCLPQGELKHTCIHKHVRIYRENAEVNLKHTCIHTYTRA
jgi:hypothetical protein